MYVPGTGPHHGGLVALGREFQSVQEVAFAQVVQVVPPLLRDVDVNALALDVAARLGIEIETRKLIYFMSVSSAEIGCVRQGFQAFNLRRPTLTRSACGA
jgi:hypothetical protein